MSPNEISMLQKRILDAAAEGRVKQIDLAQGAKIDPSQLSRFLKTGKGVAESQLQLLRMSFDLIVESPDPLGPDVALRLARLIRDDKLILFAGAGLSLQCPGLNGGAGLPSWRQLVEAVAEEFVEEEVDASDFVDTPTLFFDYVADLPDGAAKLKAAIRESIDSSAVTPSESHRIIARLPWAEIWTTNYDDLLEKSGKAAMVNGKTDFELIAKYQRDAHPFVLHLHGTVADPHTLGKRSYELWEQNNPKLTAYLRARLLAGNTVLFVGYGMGDPNLDAVFGWVRNVTGNKLRLYGFLHDVAAGPLKAYEKSVNLQAVSFSSNAEYVAAFRQIEREYRGLTGALDRGAVAVTTVSVAAPSETSGHAYERTQLAVAMRRRWDDSGVAGLYLTDAKYRADDLGVDHVFVEPSVANWAVRQETVWVDELGNRELWRDENGRPVTWDGADRDPRMMQRAVRTVTAPPSEPALATLARERLVVLLGDPGSGKSLLLRHMARAAAEAWQNASSAEPSPLPIYLRLNAWESRQSASATDVALRAVASDELLSYADVPREQIQAWTSSEHPILWLLDGLDEVRSQAARDGVREAVATLARTRPQDRFIVSARPGGYCTRFDSQWRELELQPLNDAQQAAVLERWRDITATRDNLTLDVPGLVADLKASRALSDLRGNPLMLTLAILFYRIKRRLPRDRWEYYEIVDTNLRDQLARLRALADIPVERERRAWADILGRIALAGMSAGLAENGRGKVRFSRDEIETIVVDYHRAQQCTVREALAEAERFLRAADDLLGVIVAFAPDEYGFLHLTFQEYHAARRLLHMNLPDENAEREQLMADAWDHPDWKEVWQLVALGAVNTGRLDVFESLCNAAQHNGWPELDEWLARSELQQLEWVGLVGARVFATATWVRLEAWVIRQFRGDTRHRSAVAQTLCDWSFPLSASLQMAILAILCHPNENGLARAGAAQALSSVAGTPPVTDALIAILRDPEVNRIVRRGAAQALGSAEGSPHVTEALLAILRDPKVVDFVRRDAAQALSSVAGTPEVTEALLAILRDPEANPIVRRDAAQALGSVAGTPAVTEALLAILRDPEVDRTVRRDAAQALGSVASTPEVTEALLAILRDPEVVDFVRREAAQALGSVAGTPHMTEALLAILRDPKVVCSVRGGAAQALSSVAGTPAVTEALLELLQEPTVDDFARGEAAQALGSAAGTPEVTEALLAILRDPKVGRYPRLGVVEALGGVAFQLRRQAQ